MSKSESSWYSTSLDTGSIRRVLGQTLAGADLTPLNYSPLDDQPEFGVLAEKRFGLLKNKLASAQILVHERGDHRRIQFIALGTSIGSQLGTAWQVRNESFGDRVSVGKEMPQLGQSKRLVRDCVEALTSSDPSVKQVG